MSQLSVQVVTPVETKFTGQAEQIQLPGVNGQMGVLVGHAALVTMLSPGRVEVIAGHERLIFAVAEGFATIANNQVVCLVDDAMAASQVDVAKVQQKITDLERGLAEDDNPRTRSQIAYLRAQLALKG